MEPSRVTTRVGSRGVAAGLLLASLFAPAAGAAELRTVALTGDPAPGTGPDVFFLTFESPFDPNLPVPLVDDTDQLLFFAFLAGAGVVQGNNHGLWVERGAPTSLLVRAGDPAPGTEPGVVFLGLPNDVVPIGFLPGGGAVAFPATLTGPGVTFANDEGIWSDGSGATALLVREGDPAPGLDPGVVFGFPLLHRFTAAHEALFFSKLAGPVAEEDDETVWSHLGGAFTLRAREGDPAPGTDPGVVFGEGELGTVPGAFPFADFNDPGRLLLRGDLAGPGVDFFDDEALFSDRTGSLELILREGDAAPGAPPGVTFGGNSISLALDYPRMNDLGQVAFSVRLGGSIPTTMGLFSDHLGTLELLALPGDPAPGTGSNYGSVADPVLSDAGRVAFRAGIADGDGGFPQFGIFWDQDGTLGPLILPGDAIPDRPGATLLGINFIDGFAPSGLLAFRGDIDSPTEGFQSGVFVADAAGTLQTIVLSGDVVDVNGAGDLREVAFVFPGGMAADGTVVLRLNFTDGSSGVFSASVAGSTIFTDGFESGDTSAWSVTQP